MQIDDDQKEAAAVDVSATGMASVSPSVRARAAKVRKIAQAVRAGRYPIDLDRLANAIASDELSRAT